ncbi:hypothetical protein ACFVWY_10230 [Streptomyces sp. NPDC058195]|uniref:hypothetical protein n=1 Tax=Streptomyces sp. NPDC058195 TaxID=3346375 RepID=UPI0036ED7818
MSRRWGRHAGQGEQGSGGTVRTAGFPRGAYRGETAGELLIMLGVGYTGAIADAEGGWPQQVAGLAVAAVAGLPTLVLSRAWRTARRAHAPERAEAARPDSDGGEEAPDHSG